MPGVQRVANFAFAKQCSPRSMPHVRTEAGEEGQAASSSGVFCGLDWGAFGAPFGVVSPMQGNGAVCASARTQP